MRTKKKRNWLSFMNNIAIGCIFFMVAILLIHYNRMNSFEKHSTVIYEGVKKKDTVEGFYNIQDFLKYMNAALENKDMDAFLRGCAIKEKVENYPFNYLNGKNETFSYDAALLPSANYKEYQDVNTSLIADQFIQQYNNLFGYGFYRLDGTPRTNPEIVIDEARILYPEKQMSEEEVEKQKAKVDRWKAELFVELGLRILVDEDEYMMTCSIARYDGCYKLFSLKSPIISWDNNTIVRKKSYEEFQSMTGEQDINDYIKDMESLIIDTVEINIPDGEEMEESLESGEEVVFEEKDALEKPEEEILPLNYYVVDQLYGRTPQEAINAFFLELFRNNTKKAMNYCQIYEEGDSLEDVLACEGDIARQLSYLYKGFAKLPYSTNYYVGTINIPEKKDRNKDGSINYEELDFEKRDIIPMLDPSLFYEMSIFHVIPIQESETDYLCVAQYYDQVYHCAFTMVEAEKGWQIKTLGTFNAYLQPGEVRLAE